MIRVRSIFCQADISLEEKCSHGIVGQVIDDRTCHSVEHVKKNSKCSIELFYNKDDLNVVINGDFVECHDLPSHLLNFNITSLMVDSTSLDIPELALIINAVRQAVQVDVLFFYVEPENYTSQSSDTLSMEEFELSNEILGFEGAGIPTISMAVEESGPRKFIAFVGFEAGRLQSAIETYDISSEEAKIFFGTPAFRPGWEVKSIRRNIQVLSEQSFKGRIGYCSASNVTDALRNLAEIKIEDNCSVYVLPLGTKPNSIAAIIYSVESKGKVKILYDQPNKKRGRSEGVGRRHYYYYKAF